jgi:hypothetical protein
MWNLPGILLLIIEQWILQNLDHLNVHRQYEIAVTFDLLKVANHHKFDHDELQGSDQVVLISLGSVVIWKFNVLDDQLERNLESTCVVEQESSLRALWLDQIACFVANFFHKWHVNRTIGSLCEHIEALLAKLTREVFAEGIEELVVALSTLLSRTVQ